MHPLKNMKLLYKHSKRIFESVAYSYGTCTIPSMYLLYVYLTKDRLLFLFSNEKKGCWCAFHFPIYSQYYTSS